MNSTQLGGIESDLYATKKYVKERTKEKIIDVLGTYSDGIVSYDFGKNIQFKDYNEIQFRLIFTPSQQFVVKVFGFYLNDNLFNMIPKILFVYEETQPICVYR